MQTLSRRRTCIGVLLVVLALGLAACRNEAEADTNPTPVAQATVALPTTARPTREPTAVPALDLQLGISGIGQVKGKQDAELFFSVNGTVAEVYVEEGDTVTETELLARLDVRPFDQRVRQAEAAVDDALARQAALTEAPRAFEVNAARAQVAEAEAALAELKAGPKEQDIQNARAMLEQARVNLQSQRDRLSAAKSDAELQVANAANALRDRQSEYSQIYWDNRELEQELSRRGAELPQQNKDQEETALRAVTTAEQNVEQARVAYEQARQAEITGIQAAEQEIVQAQAALDKLLLPPDQDELAAAESRIAQARAALERLIPNPTQSELNRAAAAVTQAQAQLEQARLDREYAELRAPFGGVVSIVNIDPGDPSSAGGQPVIRLVDISTLYIEVEITDIDIARVSPGQAVRIFADALPGQVFTGNVRYIAPSATVTGNVRTYEVRITPDELEGLRDGMSVRVEFETDAQ